MGYCADEPRALPWAGMNDALGVSAQLYPVLLASGEDLTQRRRESQRIAESSASLRFSAFLCTICEDLRSPRKFSWPHVTFATHLTHLTFWLRLGRTAPLRWFNCFFRLRRWAIVARPTGTTTWPGFEPLHPGGMAENSPTFQCWVRQFRGAQVPKGRLKPDAIRQPFLRDLSDCGGGFPTLKR